MRFPDGRPEGLVGKEARAYDFACSRVRTRGGDLALKGCEPAAPLADSRGRGQVFAGMKKAGPRIHMRIANLSE